jgi:hypothetical protein
VTHTIIIADSETEVDRMYSPIVQGASVVLIRERDGDVTLYRVSELGRTLPGPGFTIVDDAGVGRLLGFLR